MLKNDTVVSFRTSEMVNQLAELIAKKHGQSKSEFLSYNAIDTAMNMEKVRHQDTLADFLEIALPHVAQGMDEKTAEEMKKRFKILQTNYTTQRLHAHMNYQKRLTNIAIKSVLQDYTEEFEGVDGFIIQQCVKSIYDSLHMFGLITAEEWHEKTQNYDLYMDYEGANVIKGATQ